MERQITYRYLAPGADSSDAATINVRPLEGGEERPRHEVGEIIQLRDETRGDEAERSFEVVRVSAPVLSGFVGPSFPDFENVYVYVTDVQGD